MRFPTEFASRGPLDIRHSVQRFAGFEQLLYLYFTKHNLPLGKG